ncbi:MAG TPA: malto-oligosyltrehalose synthase [Capillimicrobium sp.]|nr:malto-oligosyltrehalose synthase [Capillimicrobium sp.]
MHPLRATYRLQLSPELTFDDVRELVPYLRDLGVSHLYLSPSLQARQGSTHGYDVVDPTTVSRELGGEEALRALAAEGLGIVLDIVPNHMGTGDENRWWSDPELRSRFFDVDPETGAYRRFFDIDDLAAVRQELPEVFEVTHGKVLELLADGVLDGLRVDHPDGLLDPAGYLRRLRDAGAEHVWVEKILHPGEQLRDWPVDGTVGYEFLNDVQGLFVDRGAEAALSRTYADFTGERRSFEEVALEAQLEQATAVFDREVDRLVRAAGGRFSAEAIADALARLPVYRTYVEPWSGRVEDADRAAVRAAGMDDELAAALLLDDEAPDELVVRFQQTSPPVTAKGIEDTAFYRYNRLLALNEVGGDPARFGVSVADFHAGNAERARRFPRNLLITQTHDTKRGGDTRARIGALSWLADEWGERVTRWRELVAGLRVEVDGRLAPDDDELWFVFQTLVGAWPIEPLDRLDGYLEKALREAKVNTSWVHQRPAWEQAVQRFARAVVAHEPFLEDFLPFQRRVAELGERSALGQLLLKYTVPGLPDTYQGDELLALNLVDPDNRRPVDWAARRAALAAVRGGGAPAPEHRKLYVIERALALRAERPDAFAEGGYEPLDAPDGVCAFVRGGEVAVVVPVTPDAPCEAALPDGEWQERLPALDGLALLARRP